MGETLTTPIASDVPAYSLDATTVFAEKIGDGLTRYEARFDHPPLSPLGFHALLAEVAPSHFPDSAGGIVADWDIVERAEDDMKYAVSLVSIHQALGNAWQQFMQSRPAFLDVMRDARDPHFDNKHQMELSHATPHIFPGSKLGLESLLTYAAGNRRQGLELLAQSLSSAGVVNAEATILDAVCLAFNKTRNPRQQLVQRKKIFKYFDSTSNSHRRKILNSLLETLPQETVQHFEPTLKDAFFQEAVLPSGERYFAVKKSVTEDFQSAVDRQRTITSTDERHIANVFDIRINGDMRYDYFAHTYTRTHTFMLPGTVKRIDPRVKTITPHLAWTSDEQGDKHFELEESPFDPNHIDRRSALLGVFVVAQQSPQIRSTWPEKMTLKDTVRTQRLGAAQVPVLLLFPHVQKQLAQSEFIAAAEAAAV